MIWRLFGSRRKGCTGRAILFLRIASCLYSGQIANRLFSLLCPISNFTFLLVFSRTVVDPFAFSAWKEQAEWHRTGLKSFILKTIWTKKYTYVTAAINDAQRVESAYKRGSSSTFSRSAGTYWQNNGPVPIFLREMKWEKFNSETKEYCCKHGLFFQCRGSGHMAKDPCWLKNAQRNWPTCRQV